MIVGNGTSASPFVLFSRVVRKKRAVEVILERFVQPKLQFHVMAKLYCPYDREVERRIEVEYKVSYSVQTRMNIGKLN